MGRKIVFLVLMVLFLLFAGVQLNDPDPYYWVALYGFVALMAALASFKIFIRPLLLLGILVCLGWAAFLVPGVIEWVSENELSDIFHTMAPDQMFIEIGREFLGLLLASLALYFMYRKSF